MTDRSGPDGLQVSWTTLVSTGVLVVMVFGAFWALIQSQVADVRSRADAAKSYTDQQTQETRDQIRHIREDLSKLREEDFSLRDHTIYEKATDDRLISLLDRIKIVERTRPTTGELQGIATNAGSRLDRIEERLKALEQEHRALIK